MTVLDGLLRAIVADPLSEDRWLVLADWLEEHDDPRRAELLRLHRRLLATCCEPELHPERGGWQARIVELLDEGVRPCVPRQTISLGRQKKIPMPFHWIPPGTFLMGSPPGEDERSAIPLLERQQRAIVTRGFWLGVHAVTQAQWRWAMGRNPSKFQGDECPVEQVTWADCQKFCTKLGKKTGQRFRLPREAEWEWACRAGTTTPFFFGACLSARQANYSGVKLYDHRGEDVFARQTTAVGSFPPNAWGLHDMHGNVCEWCQDREDCGVPAEVDDLSNEPGVRRVLRGGSWSHPSRDCRSASRSWLMPTTLRFEQNGCRVVLCLD